MKEYLTSKRVSYANKMMILDTLPVDTHSLIDYCLECCSCCFKKGKTVCYRGPRLGFCHHFVCYSDWFMFMPCYSDWFMFMPYIGASGKSPDKPL